MMNIMIRMSLIQKYAVRKRWFFIGPVVLALTFLAWKPPLLENVSFSRAVFDRNGKLMRLTISADEKYRLFVPLDEISPRLKDAVLLHEDQYFYQHAGVNPVSVARAFVQTYFSGGRKVGASTVTMQLARIKYGINSRNPFGKLWQMMWALQLELHYSKDELLEAYFNLAPYGYNIEGVGAASFIYFKRDARELTMPEAFTLAVIPQSPYKRRPERDNPSKASLLEARNRLFARWLEMHPESADQKLFFALPLATHGIKDLPFEAPHLVNYLLAAYKSQPQITASVDLSTQRLLEVLLKNYVLDRQEIGINNASALLVDTRNMQVAASVGSADFANALISGQVDGTRARRSPGSTIKPFIYALAFDQGLIHPLSILGDAPAAFGSYAPDNFDKDFKGPISARDALRLSRNVPALKLAAELRSPNLYGFLKQADIRLLPEQYYGLSLVLGGAEVSMRELAELYAMLANDGQKKPLVFQMGASSPVAPKKLVSAEASFLTLDALRDTPRPSTAARGGMNVYWKTGTSNGFHDAWTAGVFGHYALVVWVGNFSGKQNPSLVGVRSAAPLFFSMVDAVNEKEPQRDALAGKAERLKVRRLDVCVVTGDLSTQGCPALASTWFIPGVSPIRNHNVYRSVLVNVASGQRACRFEAGKTEYKRFEVWPSNLQSTLQKAGIRKPALPQWEEGCAETDVVQGAGEPVITSPQASVNYQVRAAHGEGDAIELAATADGAVKYLHWFAGSRYIGKSEPGTTLSWYPDPGRYTIRVVDDAGRSDSVRMLVSLVQ